MNLGDWRSRINDLDNQILHLLNQRAEAALQIGDLKRRQDAPSYVPEREAEILNRLADGQPGSAAGARRSIAVWREIVSACRALESPLTVAYLAPPATFTHQAARERFGESAATITPRRTIVDVFDDVERGRAQFGVVPVENTTDGAVNVTLDRLVETDAADLRRADARDRPAPALAGRGPGRGQARAVAPAGARPVPRAGWPSTCPTCRRGDHVDRRPPPSWPPPTRRVAAIASDLAGRLYGVPVLRPRIEDNRHNATRFLVLGRQPSGPERARQDVDPVRDAATSRARSTGSWSRSRGAGLNLTKIESRPAKRAPVGVRDVRGFRGTPRDADRGRRAERDRRSGPCSSRSSARTRPPKESACTRSGSRWPTNTSWGSRPTSPASPSRSSSASSASTTPSSSRRTRTRCRRPTACRRRSIAALLATSTATRTAAASTCARRWPRSTG